MKTKLALILLSMLSGCAATIPGGSICTDRTGKCFDATIDGKAVTALQSRDRLSKYRNATESARVQTDLDDTEWVVAEPVDGSLNVHASVNQNGQSWFGSNAGVTVQVLPLNGQNLASHAEVTTNKDVRVNGHAAVQQQRLLDQASVPPGDYLVKIRVSGPSNWDSKLVLVTVK